jgi:hypothetical protein
MSPKPRCIKVPAWKSGAQCWLRRKAHRCEAAEYDGGVGRQGDIRGAREGLVYQIIQNMRVSDLCVMLGLDIESVIRPGIDWVHLCDRLLADQSVLEAGCCLES